MSNTTIAVEFKPRYPKAKKLIPLLLILVVVLLDQLTKTFIVKNFAEGGYDGFSIMGDFIRIIHVRNPGIAFSIGTSLSLTLRSVLFKAIPLIVILVVIVVYFRNDEFSQLQRWSISGIAGGGLGNLIDRYFRPSGVVDFISVKFYGFLGFERWPTFNVADAAVVVCGLLLVFSFLFNVKNSSRVRDI